MSRPLIGSKLKVQRAKQHLEELANEIKEHFKPGAYEISAEIDLKSGKKIYRLMISPDTSVSPNISIIIGDIAHNLRSALDQAVCELVIANRKQVQRNTGFPIGSTEAAFETAVVSKLKGVSHRAEQFIRKLKPYKGGNTALWILSEINNMDKHNNIVPTAVGHVSTSANFNFPILRATEDGTMILGLGPGEPIIRGTIEGDKLKTIKHNSIVFRSAFGADSPMEERVDFLMEITLGNNQISNNEPVLNLLSNLVDFIGSTLETIESEGLFKKI